MDDGFDIDIKRVVLDPASPPTPLHKVAWTRVGDLIVLDVGYFDLPYLLAALNKEEKAADFLVTNRFTLTPSAALHLKACADSLVDALRKQSVLGPATGAH